MLDPLSMALLGASLLLALVTGVYVAINRSPDKLLVGVAAVLELGFVAQAVIAVAAVIGDDDIAEPVTFVGYALAILLVLPFGVLWSLSERSRGATAALALAALTVAFLTLRLWQLHG